MIPYSFSILRYMHDGVTAEFVNVGVALYAGDAVFLRAKCTTQYGRITRMFSRIDGDRFKQQVRFIEEEVTSLGRKLQQKPFPFAELESDLPSLLKRVLPPDDSALQFSQCGFGVSTDLDRTLQEVYERYVDRYASEQETSSRSDEEIWRTFRTPLERRNLISALQPKTISAPDYGYDFQAGWKNGIWHVYEPVSFDLIEPNSLLEKANRWVGRSASLAESAEKFKLHLLIGAPRNPNLRETFRRSTSILRKMVTDTELVMETEAEQFAANLERQMADHGVGTPDIFKLQ
jgi:hypothetical protein